MMMYGSGFFGRVGHMGIGYFGGVWSWLVLAGVVLLVVAGIYLLAHKAKSTKTEDSALEMLKTKFVQGEITEKEYRERKDVLDGK